MSTNEVLIVGAGVSGLAAGIYAARSGFKVTILEQHSMAGGLSTGWSRKGYYFEGGMHWLTGSSPKLPLNRVWKETGALQDNNPIDNRDPIYTVLADGKRLCLYRDVQKLKKELLDYSPEDKRAIKRLCRDIKLYEKVHLVVYDVPGVKTKNPAKPNFLSILKMAPAGLRLAKLTRQSYPDYVGKFKNKNIRHLLMSVIGYRYNALAFVYTLGSFASGDSGYPLGGSVQMAQNMVDTFEKLGGKILYRTKAENIEVEEGRVTGITTKNGFLPSENVIVSSDARVAIDMMFDTSLDYPWVNKMRKETRGEQNMFLCLGVKADLSAYPQTIIFPLEKPFEYAGCSYSELRINNYAKYKDHAPEGCTSVTCLLLGESYMFWRLAKDDGTYKQKKKELADLFIRQLEQFIPEIKDNVEVIDVATPCTYERYCSCYDGSWMSLLSPGGKMVNYPQTINGIDGLYFAGQRMMSPGGLPLAVYSGRQAAQLLCRDTKTTFV